MKHLLPMEVMVLTVLTPKDQGHPAGMTQDITKQQSLPNIKKEMNTQQLIQMVILMIQDNQVHSNRDPTVNQVHTVNLEDMVNKMAINSLVQAILINQELIVSPVIPVNLGVATVKVVHFKHQELMKRVAHKVQIHMGTDHTEVLVKRAVNLGVATVRVSHQVLNMAVVDKLEVDHHQDHMEVMDNQATLQEVKTVLTRIEGHIPAVTIYLKPLGALMDRKMEVKDAFQNVLRRRVIE